ncbi:phage adaptor protein [Bradyrhizobium cenepequi]|uniref:phage adaptor protein n=1 Tax=Bradyrhizobium cenepequi TaxID=2821403 RepID=UPI001CE37FD8|nr:hypothetical protein [Bradyrhizobium cenepequi]MCA6108099.1 hypothetical protein [Bradyrhizobium cenepequi]
MPTSGITTFSLSNAGLAVSAYSRIQIRRTALLAEHMEDARVETNLMLSKFSNLQPNLWTVDLVSVPLIQGQVTYDVDPSTIQILDAYISFVGQPEGDRLIFPISRTEYASYPNKMAQAVPTVFWFDRLINPTITLWQAPDASNAYVLNYYRARQIQDANLPGGEIPEVPYRFLDCMVAELAHRLSRIWKPELEAARKQDAAEAWHVAATQDTENVPMFIVPQLYNYVNNQ